MADIKQAAKWMLGGSSVRRPQFGKGIKFLPEPRALNPWVMVTGGGRDRPTENIQLTLEDLLADDWELAE